MSLWHVGFLFWRCYYSLSDHIWEKHIYELGNSWILLPSTSADLSYNNYNEDYHQKNSGWSQSDEKEYHQRFFQFSCTTITGAVFTASKGTRCLHQDTKSLITPSLHLCFALTCCLFVCLFAMNALGKANSTTS